MTLDPQSIQILILLLEFFLTGVSGITFSSFLERTHRRYGCPGEMVTYVCNGTGDIVDVYAPPYIPSRLRLSFNKADAVGSGLGSGSIGLFLLSTEGDYISAGVMVRESDLEECVITCEVHSNTESANSSVTHRPSGLPLNVTSPTITPLGSLDSDHSAIRVSWNANPENYNRIDLDHYIVTVFSSDNNEINSVNISSESDRVSVILPVPRDIQVYAKIRTVSMCDEITDGVSTISVQSASSGATLHFVFLVLVSAVLATFTTT